MFYNARAQNVRKMFDNLKVERTFSLMLGGWAGLTLLLFTSHGLGIMFDSVGKVLVKPKMLFGDDQVKLHQLQFTEVRSKKLRLQK